MLLELLSKHLNKGHLHMKYKKNNWKPVSSCSSDFKPQLEKKELLISKGKSFQYLIPHSKHRECIIFFFRQECPSVIISGKMHCSWKCAEFSIMLCFLAHSLVCAGMSEPFPAHSQHPQSYLSFWIWLALMLLPQTDMCRWKDTLLHRLQTVMQTLKDPRR